MINFKLQQKNHQLKQFHTIKPQTTKTAQKKVVNHFCITRHNFTDSGWSTDVKSSKSHTHTHTHPERKFPIITRSQLVRARNSQPAQQNTSKEIISSLCYIIIFAMHNQMIFKFEYRVHHRRLHL